MHFSLPASSLHAYWVCLFVCLFFSFVKYWFMVVLLFVLCVCFVSLSKSFLVSWLKCSVLSFFLFPWLLTPPLPTLIIVSCGKFIVWGFVSVTFMTEKTFAMNQREAEPSQTPGNQAHTHNLSSAENSTHFHRTGMSVIHTVLCIFYSQLFIYTMFWLIWICLLNFNALFI